MEHISLRDKVQDLIARLTSLSKEHVQITNISGADMFYTDGNAGLYEFKLTQGTNNVYIAFHGLMFRSEDPEFRKILGIWHAEATRKAVLTYS
jgi:hypothetical protein